MRPGALAYLYSRRLRVHAVQELLAGVGLVIGTALVFATLVAAASVAGSAGEVVHAVSGAASLQLHARSAEGFDERLLTRAERLGAVQHAAGLLEQPATIAVRRRQITVNLAGADTSLAVLDGLAHTLPRSTLQGNGVGLSSATAQALGIAPSELRRTGGVRVRVALRGESVPLQVSAVLGPGAFGALSQARVAVMQLTELQRLAGMRGRITRILVQPRRGQQHAARAELEGLAARRLDVASADQDVGLLHQALRPNDQADGLFAAISALLGLLFAAAALLLTVPERRRVIADLRMIGVRRSAIAQMFLFQALLLGVSASLLGLVCGYALSVGAFHQSTGYLAEAFTLGTRTVVTSEPLLIALLGGVLATCAVSAAPLLDLRRGRAIDAIYHDEGSPGHTLAPRATGCLGAAAAVLAAAASALFAADSRHALLACILLALATVLVVPLAFAAVLRAAGALARWRQRLTIVPVAISSLRATTVRSLALAATGAVALFGSVALGGSREDLLRGVQRLAHSYSSDAAIWVSSPGDNQATVALRGQGLRGRIAHLPGVASVDAFQGGFLTLGNRRVWIIARPPAAERRLLQSQTVQGGGRLALRRIAEGGWIAVSAQIAAERHTGVGRTLTLPTPSGPARLRIAATVTNVAWSPGVAIMSASDYSRLWATHTPTALGVALATGARLEVVESEIRHALGGEHGLRVSSAHEREASIDSLAGEGLSKLGEISTLLVIAAVLALATALTSAIWQRRASLAGLRLAGVRPARLRAILFVESGLMLSAGCLTGALSGLYGELVIDNYLRRVTGFPVAELAGSLRPLGLIALVAGTVLLIVAVPGWFASRVSPTLALDD
jgi:putative ABC transport system permease protein